MKLIKKFKDVFDNYDLSGDIIKHSKVSVYQIFSVIERTSPFFKQMKNVV